MLALPGVVWTALLLVAPLYVVLAILFGGVDPVLRQPVPVWNPVDWDVAQFRFVWDHIVGPDAFFRPALVRTVVYVGLASALCLVIAYPVAYYTARFAGRWKGVLLAALIAPFWISYMMRMLAWVNLLQVDGLINRAEPGRPVRRPGGLARRTARDRDPRPRLRLRAVHGAAAVRGLDRIPGAFLEAARDLGASRWRRSGG